MKIDIKNFKWIREPKEYKITENEIEIVTEPHTDLWQRTYYHFRNDNAPVLQMETNEKYFSFVVETDFMDSHTRFDQCGIVLYLETSRLSIIQRLRRGKIELFKLCSRLFSKNKKFQHLGSVVTNYGYSDWATTEIRADVKKMWYRLSRREDDYCIECSADGIRFSQMRVCHLHEGGNQIRFGVYACSPEESSFKAIFKNMQLTKCQWLAHDGQQPD